MNYPRADQQEGDNFQKSMQLYLDSFDGCREMEVLRYLSNPEEKDDAELLKDRGGLGKPPSFDGKDMILINATVGTRETTGDRKFPEGHKITPHEKIRG